MKIRLTKETLGLPVGQEFESPASAWLHDGSIQIGSSIHLENTGGCLRLPSGYWEEIPEPTEEDRLREEISRLEDIVEKQNSEIARLRSTGCTQNPSQSIERHMTAEIHPDAAQGNTEPKYRMLEANETLQNGDEFLCESDGWGAFPMKSVNYPHMPIGEEWVGRYRRRLPDGGI